MNSSLIQFIRSLLGKRFATQRVQLWFYTEVLAKLHLTSSLLYFEYGWGVKSQTLILDTWERVVN